MNHQFFEQFTRVLKQRLGNPLPGRQAHLKMSPVLSSTGKKAVESPGANPKIGSVLILFYPKAGNIYFPLIQRPTYDGVHSGQVCLPGGKKDPTDEDLIETALRESYEELGIRQEQVKILGALSELYIFASNFKVKPIVGYLEKEPQYSPCQLEVAEVIEARVEEVLDDRNIKTMSMVVRDNISIIAPYYEVQSRVVWGATAMMLSELMVVLSGLQCLETYPIRK